MDDKALGMYLNDHLGGAMMGCELADQIASRTESSPSGDLFAKLVPEIEADRETLRDIMDRLDVSPNPGKQATAWLAEKASRMKFSGATSGEPDFGLYMAIETLTLGVAGKLALWTALKDVANNHPGLADVELDGLIERARAQHDKLESERLKTARSVLSV